MNGLLQKHTGILLFYSGRELVCQAGKKTARLLYARNQLLAQQSEDLELLQTAGNNTVIAAWGRRGEERETYSPYGFSLLEQSLALAGFNGQWRDPAGGGYPLGQGKRLFSVTLMRFCSPDTESPFGRGGLGSYNYCSGDPVNFHDPSGYNRFKLFDTQGLWVFGNRVKFNRTGLSKVLRAHGIPVTPEIKAEIRGAIANNQGYIHEATNASGRLAVLVAKNKNDGVTFKQAGKRWGFTTLFQESVATASSPSAPPIHVPPQPSLPPPYPFDEINNTTDAASKIRSEAGNLKS